MYIYIYILVIRCQASGVFPAGRLNRQSTQLLAFFFFRGPKMWGSRLYPLEKEGDPSGQIELAGGLEYVFSHVLPFFFDGATPNQ